jgi:hypothetical protein
VLNYTEVNDTEVVVPDRRRDVSVLWGGVVYQRNVGAWVCRSGIHALVHVRAKQRGAGNIKGFHTVKWPGQIILGAVYASMPRTHALLTAEGAFRRRFVNGPAASSTPQCAPVTWLLLWARMTLLLISSKYLYKSL